ncbi:MAG: cytochrome B6 [Gammaproteobacteria bacterium]|jgi:cytochrome c peroxidase|nr:cytochrome B6 [Gammaproteobacteria bacterium]
MQRKGMALIVFTSSLFALGVCFALQDKAILPIQVAPITEPNKVSLGKQLYFSTVFSNNATLSCNSCHIINRGGADGIPKYIGNNRKVGLLNTPTALNASLNFRQFWDGRAQTIDDVIEDHLKDPTIFASDWANVESKIKNNPDFKIPFKNAYQGEVSAHTIKEALHLYLNDLTTPQSPFDRYLQGDKSSLTPEAFKGYQLFISYGCITCHQGPNMGGNLYQRFGIYKDYFATKTNITKADLGLYNLTGKEEDKYVFKVPSLRNITLTAPYLHDGSAGTLEEVIQLMGIYQVGQPIQPYDIPLIIKFLESLTGKIPAPE